jgi:hypothetical protein
VRVRREGEARSGELRSGSGSRKKFNRGADPYRDFERKLREVSGTAIGETLCLEHLLEVVGHMVKASVVGDELENKKARIAVVRAYRRIVTVRKTMPASTLVSLSLGGRL